MLLTAAESDAVNAEVARAEARTGVEIVAVVTLRSNHYPQIPWKAFALGAALAGVAIVVQEFVRPDWPAGRAALFDAVTILGAGATAALATVIVPAFARLFLRRLRREFEVRRCAELLFHRHRVRATRRRTGVLLLVSLFERRIEVVADDAFAGRVSAEEWRAAIDRMVPRIATEGAAAALTEGIRAIAALLEQKGFVADGTDGNELPDRPREERGP
ncbi:MAG: TPM domain-containing protein [Betaproteobacteria bacterium]|nr:TPM domain-containing protein [Betaproteobacteria bacterium]